MSSKKTMTGMVCKNAGDARSSRNRSGIGCGAPGKYRTFVLMGLVTVAVTWIGGCDLDGDPDSVGDEDPRFAPLVRAVREEMSALGVSGAAVAVLEGGEVTFARGFGTKHPNGDEAVLSGTLFRAGSITKMMTAIGLLQHVEDGTAELDDPITDYLPTLSFSLDETWAPSITLWHLLTHTSGLVEQDVLRAPPGYEGDDGLASFLLEAYPETGYLMVPPGSMYNYTNTGYAYAGLVVETLGDAYYPQLMDANVFTPLGMDRTFFSGEDVAADGDFAYGATLDDATLEPTVVGPMSYDNPIARPAGYAWTSVFDLAELLLFLRSDDEAVLSDELRQEMIGPQVDMKAFHDRYHYGFGVVHQQGVFLNGSWLDLTVLGHNGGIPGFAADLLYFPDLDFGFIALANGDDAHLMGSLEVALTTLCELPEPVQPPSLEITDEMLDSYVGHYYDPWLLGDMIVGRSGSDLTVEIPYFDDLGISYEENLVPLYPDNFIFVGDDMMEPVTFIFEDGNDAHPKWIRTRGMVAERVTMDVSSGDDCEAEPTAVSCDPLTSSQ